MIIKLIATKPKPKGVERYARYLANYMADGDRRWLRPDAIGRDYGLTLTAYMSSPFADGEALQERVLYRGALIGGENRAWEQGTADIENRLKTRSRKAKKPVRHAVLSCRSGEVIDERDCAEAVLTLAKELGCEKAAILWAAHGDTDNFHLHIMFVNVDPDSGAAIPFGQESDGRAGYKEAMQRAVARIEHAQGLQAEAGARYRLMGEELVRNPVPVQSESTGSKRAPLRQEVLAWENQSGFASFTRYAQDIAGPILDETASWRQLHERLAPCGLSLRKSRNGGEIFAEGEHVKLSSIDRRHSWSKLEGRLGTFEDAGAIVAVPYRPRVLDSAKARRWLQRDRQLREINERIDGRISQLLAARDAALQKANEQVSAYRADLSGLEGDPRLRRDIASAWPQLRAAATAVIGAAFSSRIEAVRGLRHAAAESADLDQVDIANIGSPDVGIQALWPSPHVIPDIAAPEGFDGERRGDVVCYWPQNDTSREGQPSFVDNGAIIWVNERSDQVVEAALRLAQARFGAVAVFGDSEYLRQCDRITKRLGISMETITVAEAQRRAKKTGNERNDARHYALAEQLTRINATERRRIWARAYERATPIDYQAASFVRTHPLADVSHHNAVPAHDQKLNRVSLTTKGLTKSARRIESRAAALRNNGRSR